MGRSICKGQCTSCCNSAVIAYDGMCCLPREGAGSTFF